MDQDSDDVISVTRFDDIVSKHTWKRLVRSDDGYPLISGIYGSLSGLNLHVEDVINKYGSLSKPEEMIDEDHVKDVINKYASLFKPEELMDEKQLEKLYGKSIASFNSSLKKNQKWKAAYDRIKNELKDKKIALYVPTSKVDRDEVIAGRTIPSDIKPALVADPKDVDQQTIEEAKGSSREIIQNTTKGGLSKTVALDKSSIDAIKKKEPSVEERIKSTVTKIAKNKELMSLSKDQLRDYIKEAYGIPDENSLNNMMNAVIAKRAELLANKQLKQEELTEIDISRLQEQSQRDFEKKLQDQNLRYILPAQIEKRERLIQNRLNPELLKSGY